MDTTDFDDELRYRGDLRGGGWAGVTNDHVVVSHPNEASLRLDLEEVVEVNHEPLSWVLVVLSLAVVLFGGLSLAQSRFFVGIGSVLGGLFILVFAYGRRDQIGVVLSEDRGSMKFYPTDADGFVEAVESAWDS